MPADGPARDGARHPSPPLLLLAAAHAGLLIASLGADDASRWRAFLQLGSAVPLGLFAATASSRLHFLGIRAAGATIALYGGIAASTLLAVAASVSWALAWPGEAGSQAALRALRLAMLAISGPAHLEALGILIAGIAVTAGVRKLLPAWMAYAGVAIAAAAELSFLCLVVPAAGVLIPLAHFPALAWLMGAGALLPSRRASAPSLGAGAAGAIAGEAGLTAARETP